MPRFSAAGGASRLILLHADEIERSEGRLIHRRAIIVFHANERIDVVMNLFSRPIGVKFYCYFHVDISGSGYQDSIKPVGTDSTALRCTTDPLTGTSLGVVLPLPVQRIAK